MMRPGECSKFRMFLAIAKQAALAGQWPLCDPRSLGGAAVALEFQDGGRQSVHVWMFLCKLKTLFHHYICLALV